MDLYSSSYIVPIPLSIYISYDGCCGSLLMVLVTSSSIVSSSLLSLSSSFLSFLSNPLVNILAASVSGFFSLKLWRRQYSRGVVRACIRRHDFDKSVPIENSSKHSNIERPVCTSRFELFYHKLSSTTKYDSDLMRNLNHHHN